MARGQKKLKPISQRGRGERRITFAKSRAKSTGAMIIKQPKIKKRKGVTRKITKKAMNYGLIFKNRKSNRTASNFASRYAMGTKAGSGSTYRTMAKQRFLNAKSKTKRTAKQVAAAKRNIMKAIKARWS